MSKRCTQCRRIYSPFVDHFDKKPIEFCPLDGTKLKRFAWPKNKRVFFRITGTVGEVAFNR